MESEFKGKVAFVTGASSGIGKAAALAFADEGADVVCADISPRGEEIVALLKAKGVRAFFQRCDTSNAAEVHTAIERTMKEFGRLDFAFNNAGIEGNSETLDHATEANWNHVIAVNLTGVWNCMHEQIAVMTRQGSGSIVNCSSVAGLRGFAAIAPYVASKHGVIGLTKSAALELASKGIRVNAVCPGIIMTPMIERFTQDDPAALKALLANEPIGRAGEPREVADVVTWLCSSRASFVTGVALPVDGGWVAK